MGPVLIALKDESEISRLGAACALVAPGANVQVAHAISAPVPPADRAAAERLIEETVGRLQARGLHVSGHLLPVHGPSVVAALAREVRSSRAALVVLGARGLARTARIFDQSVGRSLVAEIGTTALVVGQHAHAPSGILRRALVAIGREEETDRLRQVVLSLPGKPAVLLVHVARRVAVHAVGIGGPHAEVPETSPELMQPLRKSLIRAHRGQVAARLLQDGGHSARAIADAARSWDADLIVLCSRRPGRLADLAAGSTAHDLLRLTDRPTLLAPGP